MFFVQQLKLGLVTISLAVIFREPAIMVGRLITKVMRTSLPKSLGGLPISGGKNILLTSPLFCVTNTNLPNSLYTSPYFATRILREAIN